MVVCTLVGCMSEQQTVLVKRMALQSRADSVPVRLCRLTSSSASEITIFSQLAEKRETNLPPSFSPCSHRSSRRFRVEVLGFICAAVFQNKTTLKTKLSPALNNRKAVESCKPVRGKLKLEKVNLALPPPRPPPSHHICVSGELLILIFSLKIETHSIAADASGGRTSLIVVCFSPLLIVASIFLVSSPRLLLPSETLALPLING